MTRPRHVPVLLAEVLAALGPIEGRTIVDGTFGSGGYTGAFLAAGARVIAFDRDPGAIRGGQALVAAHPDRLRLVEARFSTLDRHLDGPVDAVVFDFGVSSMQLDEAERGFSFRQDGPLDMRMGADGPSAADLVAGLPEAALADLIYAYGDERRSRVVARTLVKRRSERAFTRTLDLAEVVASVVPKHPADPSHAATRTFQALRIAVNAELDEVALGLAAAERALAPGGRLVVVTFHSLEDRIAKTFLADRSNPPRASRHQPLAEAIAPSFVVERKKAIEPGEAEIAANPRARSAKLRSAIRTDAAPHPLDPAALGVPRVPLDGGRR